MVNYKQLVFIFLIGLLLVTPIFAGSITSIVDDKTIQHSYGNDYYFLHTEKFGDIQVTSDTYAEVMINDTITFYQKGIMGIWDVTVVT